MQITTGEELQDNEEITFIGEVPKLINSNIFVHGENNILVCEEGVTLNNSRIDFHQDNSVLYLSSNSHPYNVTISLNKDSACYIGKNNYFNGTTFIIASESKNIVIGRDCLFSYNVVIRTSDGHGIYSTESKKRMNYAKSIFIGDHVWFGQNVFVLKGTQIHSGSVIGAGSVLSNKLVQSNVTFAGNPARLTKENTFWIPHSTQGWGEEEIEKMEEYNNDLFTFSVDDTTLDFNELDENLLKLDADDALDYIIEKFFIEKKNRFAGFF
ncbi:acyltransferase [Methanobrevibacter sp.]|uniref:acyltransferase n=1 Tax=Methanobrevibacter sp. TaxID=66852 RepID=UPI0026DFD984|nr:acyltransferase [Methanobrevibacter sp.]MDO5859818.1 acyltransferase [Methanobrevibacter sp.]